MKKLGELLELPVKYNTVYVTSDIIELSENPKEEIFAGISNALNNIDAMEEGLEWAIDFIKHNAWVQFKSNHPQDAELPNFREIYESSRYYLSVKPVVVELTAILSNYRNKE